MTIFKNLCEYVFTALLGVFGINLFYWVIFNGIVQILEVIR